MRTEKIVEKFVQKYEQDFYNLINSNLSPKLPPMKNGKIPRPCNAFFQFRPLVSSYALEKKLSIKDEDTLIILSSAQGYLGKVASKLWKKLPSDKKVIFTKLFEQAKEYVTTTYPDYRYRPNRPKSIFKADPQKKKLKKVRSARGNANNNNRNIVEVDNNTNPPTSIDNLDLQMNVDLSTFQPTIFSLQDDVSDYIPQVIQYQYDWDSVSSPPLAYPTPSLSPASTVVNDSDIINDPEGFPFAVANNISYINNTLYPVSDDLIFPMNNLSFDSFN